MNGFCSGISEQISRTFHVLPVILFTRNFFIAILSYSFMGAFLKGVLCGFLFVLILLLLLKYLIIPKAEEEMKRRFDSSNASKETTGWANSLVSQIFTHIRAEKIVTKLNETLTDKIMAYPDKMTILTPGNSIEFGQIEVSNNGTILKVPISWKFGPSIDVLIDPMIVEFDLREFQADVVIEWCAARKTITVSFDKPLVLDFDISAVFPRVRFGISAVPLLGDTIKRALEVFIAKHATFERKIE